MVIEVEVLAASRALEHALEAWLILECDTGILLKALKNGGSRLSHYGHLTLDMFFLILHFSTLKLSFVRGHYNRLAHSLARRASIPPQMSVWMEEVPLDLVSVFLVDLNSLPNNMSLF